MRTSITIDEKLLRKAQKASGKKGYSEAIVTSLRDYVATRERLDYLNQLFSKKSPHSFKKIKQDRKKGSWS
jgi:Arc/MetJ family transcription regulator